MPEDTEIEAMGCCSSARSKADVPDNADVLLDSKTMTTKPNKIASQAEGFHSASDGDETDEDEVFHDCLVFEEDAAQHQPHTHAFPSKRKI